MNVIGYLRVSTADQEHGIDTQRTAITLKATRKGWNVIWLEDAGRSGKSLDRAAAAKHSAFSNVAKRLPWPSRSSTA